MSFVLSHSYIIQSAHYYKPQVALLNLLLHDQCYIDIYQEDFTNDLPTRKLPTQTLPSKFHHKIAS